MVNLTAKERQLITGTWSKICAKTLGKQALGSMLYTYPWTQRYFSSFGNLSSIEAIFHNAAVATHGEKVLTSIGEAIKHMDDIKGYYAQLSKYHSETLHVDPYNFKRFCSCTIISMAQTLQEDFTPELQAAFEKLFAAIADALGKGYH
ncbi:hypothetical protein XENTR_v10024227 [Xenopus tropicalis]|uniref:Hemoglobin subunit beta-1 n=1 Tax=Xenopus tropicalis TaxID=8364 RepID=HBB1_XENTR|nr:hemoglobin subunit beta-1 [Xenopus tropicalis]P07429.2 RecName: Full=Hemoglobin subunit beta-1; AltName: Full=Beta-1-globin; AltName: Full=Hemoglobin beta-1 chain [Xenopus tropicalis]AAA49659.1 beta globin protein [Xenopus tropicalis]AAH88022.1 beta globin [Xenopus tropicalis]KAE8579899.1 hypothetical protein XENTR_v10024227 [Xenopus tropicalis]KAE8579900.1 hypothetical protein XENTR_v10024227 [Xenopus tropicalis]|eukprot:NP_988859.1 hemoglobin subunit beta-1 [Xenopus tropicalis]